MMVQRGSRLIIQNLRMERPQCGVFELHQILVCLFLHALSWYILGMDNSLKAYFRSGIFPFNGNAREQFCKACAVRRKAVFLS